MDSNASTLYSLQCYLGLNLKPFDLVSQSIRQPQVLNYSNSFFCLFKKPLMSYLAQVSPPTPINVEIDLSWVGLGLYEFARVLVCRRPYW